jgi:hypothetical protein
MCSAIAVDIIFDALPCQVILTAAYIHSSRVHSGEQQHACDVLHCACCREKRVTNSIVFALLGLQLTASGPLTVLNSTRWVDIQCLLMCCCTLHFLLVCNGFIGRSCFVGQGLSCMPAVAAYCGNTSG